jgi:hypothetical protein
MIVNEPPPNPSVSQIAAAMIYFFLATMIWFPIGFLMATVNLKVTILIAVMAFVMNVCKMYLGVK